MTSTRVLLTTLSVRTSGKGRPYRSGVLGASRVVAFEGEADRFGNATWDNRVAEPERLDGTPPARQRPSGSDPASAVPEAPASGVATPGGSYGRHGRRAREPAGTRGGRGAAPTSATRS